MAGRFCALLIVKEHKPTLILGIMSFKLFCKYNSANMPLTLDERERMLLLSELRSVFKKSV